MYYFDYIGYSQSCALISYSLLSCINNKKLLCVGYILNRIHKNIHIRKINVSFFGDTEIKHFTKKLISNHVIN